MNTFSPASEEPAVLRDMRTGKVYRPANPALAALRQQAQAQCAAYNNLPYSDVAARQTLLAKLLQCPPSVRAEPRLVLEYARHCTVGKGSFLNHNVTLIDVCPIAIGNQVLIGPNCVISSACYRQRRQEAQVPVEESGAPVTIGHRVWIGANSIICAGVTIGDNAVIGAGSIVTTDIAANAVAFGQPAVMQRKIVQNTQ